jgi:hypothetical protein
MSEQIESRESIVDEIESRAEYYGWLSGMYARLSLTANRGIPEAIRKLLLPEKGGFSDLLAFAYDQRVEKLRALAKSDLYPKELLEKAIVLYDDPLHGSLSDAWWEKPENEELKEGLLRIMRDVDRIFVRKPGDTCTKRSRDLKLAATLSPSVMRRNRSSMRAKDEDVANQLKASLEGLDDEKLAAQARAENEKVARAQRDLVATKMRFFAPDPRDEEELRLAVEEADAGKSQVVTPEELDRWVKTGEWPKSAPKLDEAAIALLEEGGLSEEQIEYRRWQIAKVQKRANKLNTSVRLFGKTLEGEFVLLYEAFPQVRST